MIILDVGTSYNLFGLNCQKVGGESTSTFKMSFSRFGLFRVWGVT